MIHPARMENNKMYPPRRVMVSKPFIIEKSSIFLREEIPGENPGESEMVAFLYTKKRKNSIHIRLDKKIPVKIIPTGTASLRQDLPR